MFSGLPGNLFSIFTNVEFTSSFLHLCYNMCIFSYCVYEKSANINFLEPQKNTKTIKPKKPNPHPRKGQTGKVFFWLTPPGSFNGLIDLKYLVGYLVVDDSSIYI